MKQIAVIGEAMLELSHQSDTSLTLGFAGDTINFATYLRRLLPIESFDIHYVTALGCDSYSDAMLKNWQQEGINTDLICQLRNKLPGLYLIRTDETGERTFYFYRQNSAARELFKTHATLGLCSQQLGFRQGAAKLSNRSVCEIHEDCEASGSAAKNSSAKSISQGLLTMDYIYLSGITLAILDSDSRERLWKLLEKVKQKGAKIIFDTNYRASLWPDVDSARTTIKQTLNYVDIALPTFEDERTLFGDVTPEACAQRLLKNGITEVIVKCGSEPALVATIDQKERVPACSIEKEKVVDTTGAGDSFNAAYLAARWLGIKPIKAAQWGHQLAASVVAYRGAIIPLTAMPHFS